MDSSTILYNRLKNSEPFFLLAGPNVIESEDHIFRMAKHIKAITSKLGLPLVFKSSFDKANRTSSQSFRGPGIEQGLQILEKVKLAYDIPIVTDVHESSQCEAVGKVADIIQIPAFLCRQTDLLIAAAKTGKIVNIKKGQFCAPSNGMDRRFRKLIAVERKTFEFERTDQNKVCVTERGRGLSKRVDFTVPVNGWQRKLLTLKTKIFKLGFVWKKRESDTDVLVDIRREFHDPVESKRAGGAPRVIVRHGYNNTAEHPRDRAIIVEAKKSGVDWKSVPGILKDIFNLNRSTPMTCIIHHKVMANSAEKVRLSGNQNVMVCERGTMFGYNDLIVDPRNLEWMREANCPIVADITHALQQPAGRKLDGGGVASGGLRELIPCIARTSVAVGVDGIFMEVHDDPLHAPVDGPTQWPLRHLEELLEELMAIAVRPLHPKLCTARIKAHYCIQVVNGLSRYCSYLFPCFMICLRGLARGNGSSK
ncbi:hypothetical protein IFM89_011159 [Coptis chinensis]|uniref:3-deoxy-8-phosphooctulonate synthase n=1 Tax=Coptis chinensis TaxID=261450 RepID=A0A835HUY8_9MAGN|nr:hypothetical protein IFM89_011159 [Coptis chinensis]